MKKTKKQRLNTIREIIEKNQIKSQDELSIKLKELDFHFTQATISRDLKLLKVSKITNNNGYYQLVLPENLIKDINSNESVPIDIDKIKEVSFSNNILIIKTFSGYANGVAASIDRMNFHEILGTIAGDDTIFIVFREELSKKNLITSITFKQPNLSVIFKNIK